MVDSRKASKICPSASATPVMSLSVRICSIDLPRFMWVMSNAVIFMSGVLLAFASLSLHQRTRCPFVLWTFPSSTGEIPHPPPPGHPGHTSLTLLRLLAPLSLCERGKGWLLCVFGKGGFV